MDRQRYVHCSIFLLVAALSLASSTASSGRHLIVIVFNGLRSSDLKTNESPAVERAVDSGVTATVRSVFPAETFPNQYSILTGLTPSTHGVLWNRMLDEDTNQLLDASIPKNDLLLQGEPIWTTAAREHVHTAIFTSGKRQSGGMLTPPCAKCDPMKLIDSMVGWLRSSIDRNASASTLSFISFAANKSSQFDKIAGHCLEKVQTLNLEKLVDVLFTGDHGLSDTKGREPICLSEVLQGRKYDIIDYSGGAVSMQPVGNESEVDLLILLRDIKGIKAVVPYLEFGRTFHVGSSHRAAPLTITASSGYVLLTSKCDSADIESADSRSGYDSDAAMSTVLLASGPRFASGVRGSPVGVTSIHQMMCAVLKLGHGACHHSPSAAVDKLLASESTEDTPTEEAVVINGQIKPTHSHRFVSGVGVFFIILAGFSFLGGIYGLRNFFLQRRRSAGYRLMKTSMDPDLSMRTQPLLDGDEDYLGGSLQLSVLGEKSFPSMAISDEDEDDGPPLDFDV